MDTPDLQAVADITAEEIGLSTRPKIEVKDTQCGRARPKTNKITIPLWATKRIEEFVIYYTVHEVCHFKGGMKHTPRLKKLEQGVLKQWDIMITYAKAYPKMLCSMNGKKLCDGLGEYRN